MICVDRSILSMYGLWQAIIRLPLGIAAIGLESGAIYPGRIWPGRIGGWMMGTSQDVSGLLIGRAVTGLSAGDLVVLARGGI